MKRFIPILVLALQGCPVARDIYLPQPTASPGPQPQYLASGPKGQPYLLANELHLVAPDGTDRLLQSWEREARFQYLDPGLRFVLLATGGRLVAKRVEGGERRDLMAFPDGSEVQAAQGANTLAVRADEALYLVDAEDLTARLWPGVAGKRINRFRWAATGLNLVFTERSNALYVTSPDQEHPTFVAALSGIMEFMALLPDQEHVLTTWYNDKYAGIVEVRTYAVADGKETRQVIDVSGGQGPGVAHAEVRELSADGTRLIADLFRTDNQGGRIAIDLANGTWAPLKE